MFHILLSCDSLRDLWNVCVCVCVCSASAQMKRKLEQSGLELSRFCCITLTGSTTKVFWCQREIESYKYSRRNVRHSGDARLESCAGHRICWRFWWFSSVQPEKYRDSVAIRSWPLPNIFILSFTTLPIIKTMWDTVSTIK